MVPLGFSIVASVRTGQAMGRKDLQEVKLVARSSLLVITATMIFTAILFIAIPENLVMLFLDPSRDDSAQIIALGVSYLAFAAAFQIFDGAQVAGISILRGMLDMFWPAVLAFISFWMIGMPLGYYLAFHAGWSGQGIWMGLVVGLGVASIMMWTRFYFVTRPKKFAELTA